MYKEGNKLIEISKKLNIPQSTIRSWKKRYEWDNNKGATLQSKKCNVAPKKVAKHYEDVADNLSDKQRLFCSYYIKYRNKTKAYMKAYGCSYDNADAHAYGLWANEGIREEIERRLKEFRDNVGIDAQDIVQKYIDVAFADINDYLVYGKKRVPVMAMFGPVKDASTGKPLTEIVNYVDFKESIEIDGTLISEVKQGKGGVSIKLLDKMKAYEWLGKHLTLLDTATKLKYDLEKEKFELEKSKVTGDVEENEDDGFIKALKGTVSEVWADEENQTDI